MSEAKIDLHAHTYFSDGWASPGELVNYASAIGVQVLAICDHDNAGGVREALPIASQAGIRLVAAIEFTTHGIEIYHHAIDQTARSHFLTLAHRYNLAITGGSDEHGWPSGLPYLGNQPVTFAMLEKLARKAGACL